MKNLKYDVAIAYRIYPKVSGKPPIFKNDKYKLAELCLKSFKDCLGSLKVKLWVLVDKCPPEYEELFKKYFDKEDLRLIILDGIGNQATFNLQIKILLEQNFSNIVYFAEDDYFYFPKQFEDMISFLKMDNDVDFISPYDHLDNYTKSFHQYKSTIKVFRIKHWRENATTCCTFLTTKKTLKQTKKTLVKYYNVKNIFSKYKILRTSLVRSIFREFILVATDSDIWLSFTKKNVFRFFRIIRLRFQERWQFGIYFRAWRFHWRQILFGKKYKLWTPIPTIATHLESKFLAPTFNWTKIMKNEFKKLKNNKDFLNNK